MSWLRRSLQPSLVRRLVVAQGLTLALVWFLAVGLFVQQAAYDDSHYEPKLLAQRADMVLGVVDALLDEPEALQRALEKVDLFQRSEGGVADNSAARTAMTVTHRGRLLYVTPGEPGALASPRLDSLERVSAAGAEWRIFERESSASGARVALVRAGDAGLILSSIMSRGLLVLPLLLSLPFLILPAWFSTRLALKPWKRLATELEARAPDDLTALRFASRHRELVPLTRAIDGLLSRLREGVERERSFIADAAHELRTPLAAIRIHIEALEQVAPSAGVAVLLDGLSKSCGRAARLVSQLLTLMRSDTGRVKAGKAALSVNELAADCLAELEPLALARSIELVYEGCTDDVLQAERDGLLSMLLNLVENAIKYSPESTVVRVAVAHQAPDGLCLTVEDQGPGVPPALQERVFDRFFRVPGHSQPGSGLGLAIVRAVVVRHSGQVRLRSGRDGRGLCVEVFLPRGTVR